MHTAFDIKKEMFAITLEGRTATREELVDWEVRDRLGVLISEPVGALGVGLLVLLIATAFYDMPGKKRRMRPLYPEVFLIHAGGPWGSHAAFDFMPDHKEIFATPDPVALLRVINNLGITHLALPERPRRPVQHRFKEPEAAHDRIKQCFVYGPGGTVTAPQARIEVRPAAPVLGNYESTLFPRKLVAMLENRAAAPELRVTSPQEIAIWLSTMRGRLHEISEAHPSHQRAVQRIARARREDALSEELRCVDVATALEMLG